MAVARSRCPEIAGFKARQFSGTVSRRVPASTQLPPVYEDHSLDSTRSSCSESPLSGLPPLLFDGGLCDAGGAAPTCGAWSPACWRKGRWLEEGDGLALADAACGVPPPAGAGGLGPLLLGRSKTTAPVELGGAVEVLGQLGAGSFGRVYLCRVKGINGQVAVKLREPGAQPEGCLEGQLDLAGLAHPRLVRQIQVLHCSVDALVFELCPGGSLQDLVHRRRGTFKCSRVSQRLRVVSEVVSAASYLHSMQIVHRDIKPSNVFLMHQVADAAVVQLPPVKLGDFGLARLVRSWRDPREMERCVGTARYMAPEVMTEIDYGFAADVFSCAILMHELVSGKTPYSSPKKPTESKLMLDVLGGERPSLELVSAPGATLQLRNLVAACWQPDPALRPEADALLAEVQELLPRVATDEDSVD